jgi:Cyclin-dependent kinase 2-associated protein
MFLNVNCIRLICRQKKDMNKAAVLDDDVIIESSSSGPGTPMGQSNPETPRSVVNEPEAQGTPPPSAARMAALTGSMVATPAPSNATPPSSKYGQLLAVIEEMGRAGGKTSAERLKRNIMHARILVRECLMECDRAARS